MRRLAMLAALLLVGLVAPPATAGAGWETYPCSSGTLDAAASTATRDAALLNVTAPGRVDCAVPAPGPLFAIAVFASTSEHGLIDHHLLARYSTTGPRAFEAVGVIELDDPSTPFPLALCLMSDESTRLSCVRIDMNGQVGTVTQLSTSDLLVARPISWATSGTNPGCASCWRIR